MYYQDFLFLGSKITVDGDCSHEIRWLLLGRKAMINLDNMLKSRDITLLTKVGGGGWMNGSVQFSSVTQSCLILCDPMDCSTPGLPVHHQLPVFTQLMSIESLMPCNHLILCCPLLLPPSIFPNWVGVRGAKYPVPNANNDSIVKQW